MCKCKAEHVSNERRDHVDKWNKKSSIKLGAGSTVRNHDLQQNYGAHTFIHIAENTETILQLDKD